MGNFNVTYLSVPGKISSDGYTVNGACYTIGTKVYRNFVSFSSDVSKAFSKTMPADDKLVVKVEYMTEYRGADTACLTASNYVSALAKMSSNLSASKMTLDELLGD